MILHHVTVLHAHQAAVSTANEQEQSRETHLECSKDIPQQWLISSLLAKTVAHPPWILLNSLLSKGMLSQLPGENKKTVTGLFLEL